MRARSSPAALALLSLVGVCALACCSPATTSSKADTTATSATTVANGGGNANATGTGGGGAGGAGGAGSTGSTRPSSPAGSPARTTVPSTSTAAAPTVVPITGDPDAGGPGSLARALLEASSPYRRVVVQVDVAGDAAPPSAVVDRLVTILQTETEKPVTRVDGDHFAGQGKGCWTEDELAQATRDHRHARTSSVTVALYVVFLDGTACGDANTLGVAYGASEMAVFTDATKDVSGPTVDPERFIEAVAVHELGHTLGLVNIGYRSPIDHEDPQHPHHSSDRASVMYWAIDRGDLIQQFVTGPPRAFDRADESDLAGLRDGSL